MLTATKLAFVSTQWNSALGHTTIRVDVTLNNDHVVNEEYAILGLERDALVQGRLYGVVGSIDSPLSRGVVGIHPTSQTRFAVGLPDPLNAWADIVTKFNDAMSTPEDKSLLRAICGFDQIANA